MTALIVFARRPRPGAVKRRLARAIGRARAAACYAALLARTLALAEASGLRPRILMPASARDLAWFRARLAPRGWRVRPQCSGGLGRRMARAFAGALGAGHQAILIGSDVVDAEVMDLVRAARALAGPADAVLGPAADGGYWLLGLARPLPGLFERMPWGTAAVGALTLARLGAARAVCLRLPPRRDLDRGRDLLSVPAGVVSGCAPARSRRRNARAGARYADRDR